MFEEEPAEDDEAVEEAYPSYLDARKKLLRCVPAAGIPQWWYWDHRLTAILVQVRCLYCPFPPQKGLKERVPRVPQKGLVRVSQSNQVGHWASQCPMPSSSSPTSSPGSSSLKRSRDSAHMAADSSPSLHSPDESSYLTLHDGRLVGQHDGGASAMPGGHQPLIGRCGSPDPERRSSRPFPVQSGQPTLHVWG